MKITVDYEKTKQRLNVVKVNLFDNFKPQEAITVTLTNNKDKNLNLETIWSKAYKGEIKPCITKENCLFNFKYKFGSTRVTYTDLRLLKSYSKQKELSAAKNQMTKFTCLKPLVNFGKNDPLFFVGETRRQYFPRTNNPFFDNKDDCVTLEHYLRVLLKPKKYYD